MTLTDWAPTEQAPTEQSEPPPLAPRPHQVSALTDLVRAFATHDRAQLVMACGTGKTLVARWHAEASTAQRVLVMAPSLALLAQTVKEWRRPHTWPFEALVVCSDPTTSAGAAERKDSGGGDVAKPFWAQQRARVTTDPETAARFFRQPADGRPQVVFSTYHSAPVVSRAQQLATDRLGEMPVFDLAILDEAHRLAGRPQESFRTVLDRRAIVARRRLFMTATPHIVESSDPTVLSMDDHATFGRVAHEVTFGEAIDAGLLVDYRVLVVAAREDADLADAASTVPAAVFDAVDRFDVRRLLTFHGRVAKAELFAQTLDATRTPAGAFIRAQAVHGGQAASDRSEALRWLGDPDTPAGQVRLLASARCLSEGVDVPSVDGVLFADPRSSVVDVIQAVGRVLRPAPGKTVGTVVIPVPLDAAGDDDSELTSSAWEPVWTVLRALKAHDNRLAAELDRATRDVAVGRRRTVAPERIHFVLPAGIDLAKVRLRLVQQVGTAWERFYALLRAWTIENGGRRIPYNLNYKDTDLGPWAERQRMARRRGVLPATRAERLENLAGWAWDRAEAEFDDTVAILAALADARGDLDERYATESPYAGLKTATKPAMHLGTWVGMQRQAWREHRLPEDRARKLEKLPGWSWTVLPAEDAAMVDALAMYVEFEKTARVPTNHVEDGLPLGRWCWDVRRRYWTGQIQPALIDEITAVTPSKWAKGDKHWSWEKAETMWRLAFTALRQYAKREGHASPPGTHREELPDVTIGLGQWVALQRHRRRRGELSNEHAAVLEQLPGWRWDAAGVALEAEAPIDLGGHPHGTAKGAAAGCKCSDCLERSRSYSRAYLARRRANRLKDPVPAAPARAHIEQLSAEVTRALAETNPRADDRRGSHATAVAAAAGVPYGVVKTLRTPSEPDVIERTHAQALLALTVENVMAVVADKQGSRGRPASSVNERLPAQPTKIALTRLALRGLGPSWVARELGYARKVQIGERWVTRRVAEAVEGLVKRVGDLSWSGPRNQTPPTLAELLEQHKTKET